MDLIKKQKHIVDHTEDQIQLHNQAQRKQIIKERIQKYINLNISH
jgi:hypothetical protein